MGMGGLNTALSVLFFLFLVSLLVGGLALVSLGLHQTLLVGGSSADHDAVLFDFVRNVPVLRCLDCLLTLLVLLIGSAVVVVCAVLICVNIMIRLFDRKAAFFDQWAGHWTAEVIDWRNDGE